MSEETLEDRKARRAVEVARNKAEDEKTLKQRGPDGKPDWPEIERQFVERGAGHIQLTIICETVMDLRRRVAELEAGRGNG